MDFLVRTGQESAETVSQYDRNRRSIWCVSSINVWIPVTIRRQISKHYLFTLILYHFAKEAIREEGGKKKKKKGSPNTKLFSTSKVEPNLKISKQSTLYAKKSPLSNYQSFRTQFSKNSKTTISY